MSRKKILSELKSTLDSAKSKLDALDPKSKDIYIHCTGGWARCYLDGLHSMGLRPKAYLDNDRSKQGKIFDGVDVIAPEDVADKSNALVLICSLEATVNQAVSRKLDRLDLPHLNIDGYIFSLYSTEIMHCAETFDDDESVSVYSKMIDIRMAPENTWVNNGNTGGG